MASLWIWQQPEWPQFCARIDAQPYGVLGEELPIVFLLVAKR